MSGSVSPRLLAVLAVTIVFAVVMFGRAALRDEGVDDLPAVEFLPEAAEADATIDDDGFVIPDDPRNPFVVTGGDAAPSLGEG